jgi:ABC-type lipoprotein export system ATPase subunit
MIRIENLVKNYRLGDETVHALDVANLDITDGEFVAIIGPSGSGKVHHAAPYRRAGYAVKRQNHR